MQRQANWQKSHYELTYLVYEDQALGIRDFIRSYLDMDAYCVGRANYSFPVHTLYLDSNDLSLYWKAINDAEHRCELRIRYYATSPDAPIWLEIKRRASGIVTRERCELQPEALTLVLDGQLLDPNCLFMKSSKQLVAMQKFIELLDRIQAKPKLHICFMRESYVSDNENVRVSLDRQICCELCAGANLKTDMEQPTLLFASAVLLELNFKERFPDFFKELVQNFDLMECEADKYVKAVTTLGPNRLQAQPPCAFNNG